MTSGNLTPSEPPERTSNEIQFALVIARMIESLQANPDDMRQAVYDLARYKLREQFTHADAREIARTEQALENAIRGVEEFSKQQVHLPAPDRPLEIGPPEQPASAIADAPMNARIAEPLPPRNVRPKADRADFRLAHPMWPRLKRTAGMILILVGIAFGISQRERLLSLGRHLTKSESRVEIQASPPPTPVSTAPVLAPVPAKPAPLRPTDYGIYAVSNDALVQLQQLPGRAPDIRIAVSAAIKTASQAELPNGHPKFIVFRREAASSISDHPDVRIIAKVAREFSADAAGKKPGDGDETWVMRNVSFPFRASPVSDNTEMYELHSEDPNLELTPGRYALVLGTQYFDFSVAGKARDPRQCIERIVSLNGTFYSDCRKLQ